MTDRFPDFLNPAVDSNGDAISGAQLFFYRVGTSTKKNTYSDSAKTTANDNPVVADSAGRFGDIFMLVDELYKVVLAPATDTDPPVAPIDTWDNVSPVLDNPTAQIPVISKSTTYNVGVDDRGKLVECDASGGAFSVNLLAAATAANGFTIRVKKTDSSANAVTVDGDGAETIDGATTYALNAQYDFVDIVTDGTEWHIVGTSQTASGAVWEQIGVDTTASSDATIDFTWAGTTYKKVIVIVNHALPATNDVEPWIRTTTDASSFDAGASDYAWSNHAINMETSAAAVDNGDDADASIVMSDDASLNESVGNAANEGWSGVIEIIYSAETTYTRVLFKGAYFDANATPVARGVDGSGYRLSAADVDGVQFLFESGNVASGEFSAYGLI